MANVVIGCKLPHGIRLNIEGTEVHLKGANSSLIFGGYGMTEVDSDLADKLFDQYADAEYIKREMIFKQANAKSAQSAAEERKDEKTGLEGLNKDAPMSGITPTDEQKTENQKAKGKE